MRGDSATLARASSHERGAESAAPPLLRLQLLSGFAALLDGEVVDLPLSVQRVVVFLSLQGHPLHRQHVAGTLWPETTDQRASANLRSALWRLNQLGCPFIKATGSRLESRRTSAWTFMRALPGSTSSSGREGTRQSD